MQIVPIRPLPNQTLQVQLDRQATALRIYQIAYGLFVDVTLNGAAVISGVIAQNLNRIVRSAYLGFAGDLIFVDTQGDADPIYTGLGSRFLLVYLDAADLAARGLSG